MSGIRKVAGGNGWEETFDGRLYVTLWEGGFAFVFDSQEKVSTFSYEKPDDLYPTEVDFSKDELEALVREQGTPADGSTPFPILSDRGTYSRRAGSVRVYYGDLGMAFEVDDPRIVWELSPSALIEFTFERGEEG